MITWKHPTASPTQRLLGLFYLQSNWTGKMKQKNNETIKHTSTCWSDLLTIHFLFDMQTTLGPEQNRLQVHFTLCCVYSTLYLHLQHTQCCAIDSTLYAASTQHYSKLSWSASTANNCLNIREKLKQPK